MKLPTRWIVLIGAFMAYMFDSVELSILALELPAMRSDLAFSTVSGGMLSTVTLIGIGVSSIVIGRLADRYGRKRALMWSLGSFGGFTALVAAAPSVELIMVLRFLAGLGLGGVWALVSTYVVETWPKERRGRAVAFVLSSFAVGGLVAAAIVRFSASDWRLTFLIAGLSAILPILYCGFFMKESDEWLSSSAGRRRTVASVVAAQEVRYSFRDLFRGQLARNTIVGTLVCGFALTGFWGVSAWLPTFLADERGIDSDTVTMSIAFLNLGMFVGYNVFGLFADKIGRKYALFISLLGVGIILPFYSIVENEAVLIVLGPTYAFFAVYSGILGSYLGELFPTELRATGSGFCFNVGRGLSALAPLLLGYLATTQGFGLGFAICGALFLMAGLLVLLLPSTYSPRRDRNMPDSKGLVESAVEN